jgi:hypothetical protein
LRLIRTIDAKCLASIELSSVFADIGDAFRLVARDSLSLLSEHAEIAVTPIPREYVLPKDLSQYLLRLEQLLAIRISTTQSADDGFLSGERAMVDGNIALALTNPRNPTTRIVLLETVLALKKSRPEIIKEYRGKLELLQREHPLPGPVGKACAILLEQALA